MVFLEGNFGLVLAMWLLEVQLLSCRPAWPRKEPATQRVNVFQEKHAGNPLSKLLPSFSICFKEKEEVKSLQRDGRQKGWVAADACSKGRAAGTQVLPQIIPLQPNFSEAKDPGIFCF